MWKRGCFLFRWSLLSEIFSHHISDQQPELFLTYIPLVFLQVCQLRVQTLVQLDKDFNQLLGYSSRKHHKYEIKINNSQYIPKVDVLTKGNPKGNNPLKPSLINEIYYEDNCGTYDLIKKKKKLYLCNVFVPKPLSPTSN